MGVILIKTYITVSGDTFDKIAFEKLGSEYLLPILLDRNQQYRHHTILPAGIELIIPDIDVEETDEIPNWLSDDMNDENGADDGEAVGTWNPEEEQF